jgi:CMP-N-acetylneuraminic acid synthetase
VYSGRRVLAVIPARGGSKGIARKNLRTVGGKPLVTRAAEVARLVEEIDCVVVSTDDDEIASAAQAGGAIAPFRRPASLSGDRIADMPVLLHALEEMERAMGTSFEIVLMLQPTSPFRRPEHLRAALKRLVDAGVEAVWSLSATDSKAHPLKQLIVHDDQLDYYDPRGSDVVARQQLQTLYHRNGAVYAFTSDFVRRGDSVKAQRTAAVIIDEPMVNIDTPLDLEFAEFLAARSIGFR